MGNEDPSKAFLYSCIKSRAGVMPQNISATLKPKDLSGSQDLRHRSNKFLIVANQPKLDGLLILN